ncbi:MAG: MarR family transcriptional regulator [Paracoccaceae bacterium]
MINNQDIKLDASASAALSKGRLRLWLKILKTSKFIESELREKLRVEFGTTLPRFDVMSALERAENGLKMSEISGALKVSNGNVTGIVNRLSVEGNLMRMPVEGDRRAMRVCLTQKGRDTFAELAAVHEIWVGELLDGLGLSEVDQLAGLLDNTRGAHD